MPFKLNNISKRSAVVDQVASDKRTAPNSRRNVSPGIGVVLLAMLAMMTVQTFRVGHSRCLWLLFAELLIFTALPWVVFCISCLANRERCNSSFSNTSVIGIQIGAIVVPVLVVLWHIAIRPFGFGDANEIIALLTLQSVGWYLAVFSKVPGFEKASSLLSGALVFFVCCIADDFKVLMVAALFAFVGLWWLLGQYWNRLESKAIDGETRLLKLHGSAVSLTMLIVILVACIVAAVPFSQNGIFLDGFMPFSGGEKGGESAFAISGIGDGNMLTAGNNATTTGAVESDQFIEDHKPSLYDITSERYDGPVMKTPRNRTVALDAMAEHLHEVKQSEQSGRTFRTMRNSDKTTDLELEDRITKALLYVEGSVPARLAINGFSQFDGWDWSRASNNLKPAPQPRFFLNKQNGSPVFKIAQSTASYLTQRRTHRAKIMRLDSKTVPSPALLQQWHIPLVDQLDFFRWNAAGLIEMDCDSIPTHTIIDLKSHIPNYHLLREYKNDQQITPESTSQHDLNSSNDSRYLQIPDCVWKPEIVGLADRWTAGIEPGWMQIESIVDRLRNDFDLIPNWDIDEDTDDSVSHFMDQGGGPSYMFATTCAMCLRSAGYKTRIASGFLIQKRDYDARARQSVVTARNLHLWPEVCLDGKFWIPVEPTPGYPIPYSTQTLSQWITAQATMIWRWLLSHPLTAILCSVTISLAVIFRAEWITSTMLGWWFLVRIFWPRRLLKTTRQLIDLRFWFSGNRRPASQTINAWYTRVDARSTATFCRLWNAENYSDKTFLVPNQTLALTCHQALNALSLKRIRNSHSVANSSQIHDTEN